MVLPRFAARSVAGEPITVHGDGTQTRCFCYVGDVVEALCRLLIEPGSVGEAYNIGGNEEVSMIQLAQRVIEAAGSSSTVRLIPYDEAYEVGFEDMRRRVPDTTKIRTLIDWEAHTSLDEIIDLVVAEAKKEHDNRVVGPSTQNE
jgi:UDP-glucose 4-epimerase